MPKDSARINLLNRQRAVQNRARNNRRQLDEEAYSRGEPRRKAIRDISRGRNAMKGIYLPRHGKSVKLRRYY